MSQTGVDLRFKKLREAQNKGMMQLSNTLSYSKRQSCNSNKKEGKELHCVNRFTKNERELTGGKVSATINSVEGSDIYANTVIFESAVFNNIDEFVV